MLHLSQACVMPTLTAMTPVLRDEEVKGRLSGCDSDHLGSSAMAG